MASIPTGTYAMDPLELERAGWRALATGGAAAGFYAEVLADDVLILMPGGTVIDDRDAVVASMSGPPWSSFELSDERVLTPAADCTVVAYRARARRGNHDYEALISSTYARRRDAWKLAVHQHTPVG